MDKHTTLLTPTVDPQEPWRLVPFRLVGGPDPNRQLDTMDVLEDMVLEARSAFKLGPCRARHYDLGRCHVEGMRIGIKETTRHAVTD